VSNFVARDPARTRTVVWGHSQGGHASLWTGILRPRYAPDVAIVGLAGIAQGLSDLVVPPAATNEYVDSRCVAGQRLEYWTLAGRDHGSIVQPGLDDRGSARRVDHRARCGRAAGQRLRANVVLRARCKKSRAPATT